MGTFSVDIEIANLSSKEFRQLAAIVDSGATYTVIPRNILQEIGVQPIDTVPFELADDQIRMFEVGEARLRLEGRERIVLVVFGSEGGTALLGATALELFSRGVDPVNRRLVPVTALLKNHVSWDPRDTC